MYGPHHATGFLSWGGGVTCILITALILLALLALLTPLFRSASGNRARPSRMDRDDSEAILRARYAKGEISQDEYQEMRRILGL